MRKLKYRTWLDALDRGEDVNGDSPGGAAARLGISRQQVHRLLSQGKLKGIRVVHDDGSLAAIVVNEDSLKAYGALRELREGATA